MKEININDPWAMTVEENNIGGPLLLQTAPDPRVWQSGLTISLPKNAGYWEVNKSLRFYVEERPNRLHRLMTRLLLGWEWTDT